MPSDANSISKQHEKSVIFLDRNLGKTIIANTLRQNNNIIVEIHDDHFPPDAKDHDILLALGKRNWIFLTKDKRIRYSRLAQDAITESKVKTFYLSTRGDLNGKEMAEIFSKAINRIIKFASKNKPPFIAKISRDGKITPTQ